MEGTKKELKSRRAGSALDPTRPVLCTALSLLLRPSFLLILLRCSLSSPQSPVSSLLSKISPQNYAPKPPLYIPHDALAFLSNFQSTSKPSRLPALLLLYSTQSKLFPTEALLSRSSSRSNNQSSRHLPCAEALSSPTSYLSGIPAAVAAASPPPISGPTPQPPPTPIRIPPRSIPTLTLSPSLARKVPPFSHSLSLPQG